MDKLKVGIIFGGRSGEHEVSLMSATSVLNYLDKDKYEPVPIGITKEGRWLTAGNPLEALKRGNIKGEGASAGRTAGKTRCGLSRPPRALW